MSNGIINLLPIYKRVSMVTEMKQSSTGQPGPRGIHDIEPKFSVSDKDAFSFRSLRTIVPIKENG